MRVGILTSWRVPCGVYQYSARFADALKRVGAEPVILAGRADEHRSVPEESEHEVHDVAKIGLWRDDGAYWLEWETIHGLDLDVIHVQYQSMLFDQAALHDMATAYLSGDHPAYALTFHDSCNRPDFPWQPFHRLLFTHRAGVGLGPYRVVPFGIEERPPIVRTFGLGRSRADLLAPICERNGWIFETAASHEPIHGGGQAWRTHDELIAWLRGADAVVLWYDEQPMAGSSQAARTAIASRRPVITNDTTWFSDLPVRIPGAYVKVESLEQLEERLRLCFTPEAYIAQHSWDRVAETMLANYAEAGA